LDKETLIKELKFKGIRSSGAGGQHVNKVASKVELVFNIPASRGLTDTEKSRIRKNLKSRLTQEYNLIVYCEETRSQHRNKELATKKLLAIIEEALKVKKKRKKTKPSRAAVERRLKSKRKASEKKTSRKKPRDD
jgi:ribosome-associated protein